MVRVEGIGEDAVDRSLERAGLSARVGDEYGGDSLNTKQRLSLGCAASEGNPPPQVWEWEVLLPVTVGWTALIFAVAFMVHRRRDL